MLSERSTAELDSLVTFLLIMNLFKLNCVRLALLPTLVLAATSLLFALTAYNLPTRSTRYTLVKSATPTPIPTTTTATTLIAYPEGRSTPLSRVDLPDDFEPIIATSLDDLSSKIINL